MSMVLVIRYDDEPLCATEGMVDWFTQRGVNIDDDNIEVGNVKIGWNNMKKVNSLIFTIDVENDEDFPPVLFEFIDSLRNKDTIISLAEESISGYQLIFEANLKRFQQEILVEE